MTKKNPRPAGSWHTGSAVDELLTAADVNPEHAAMSLGASRATLYRWLLRDEWPANYLERASAYFGVNQEWLETGRGAKWAQGSAESGVTHPGVERLMLLYQADMKRLSEKYTRAVVRALEGKA